MGRGPDTIDCCTICGKTRPCEKEHFWPARFGGKKTRPMCVSCHDALDRVGIEATAGEHVVGLSKLCEFFGDEWLRLLGGCIPDEYQTRAGLSEFRLPASTQADAEKAYQDLFTRWYDLPPEARLTGLKVLRLIAGRFTWGGEPEWLQGIDRRRRVARGLPGSSGEQQSHTGSHPAPAGPSGDPGAVQAVGDPAQR